MSAQKESEGCVPGHRSQVLCAAFIFVFVMGVQELGTEYGALHIPGKRSVLSCILSSGLSNLEGWERIKRGEAKKMRARIWIFTFRFALKLN